MYQQAKARHPSYIQSGLQSVWEASQKDCGELSPVDLSIDDSHVVHLAPLVWSGYRQRPATLTVRNSGYTVMVNACFGSEAVTPRLSQGPLRAEYTFSQIHFHWGEHNRTGSGHAVKGVRYPLEMHVVHLKKDCANFKEAVESKDGIVIMVYLFALREERNYQLDQLTAILQFIRQSGARARLHPTALSELVPPFTSDYFLYWGAVGGAPKGRYRILWMVTRNVLPVSAQQLREFRQLYDKEGNLLLSNSNKPLPLGERTLFLVSPSEEMRETVYDFVGGTAGEREDSDQNDATIEIRDAEYKSLADLEEVVNEGCRVCSGRKRLQNMTRVNVAYPYRVYDGDTSVEESCVDLSNSTTDEDPGVTVKTETKTGKGGRRVTNVTNVNVTTCRRRCRAPGPEEVYAVVSARGSELHLRRRLPGAAAATVRQHEPSVEQACVMLAATRSNSAPSLAWRGLSATQEHTDLADAAPAKLSSEVAVHDMRSTSRDIERTPTPPPPRGRYREYNEYEDEAYEENLKSSRKTRRVTVVDDNYCLDEKDPKDRRVAEIKSGKSLLAMQKDNRFMDKQLEESGCKEYEIEDRRETKDDKESKYFLVQRIQEKNPFYKVIGELPKGQIESETTHEDIPYVNDYSIDKNISKRSEEDPAVHQNQGMSKYSEFRQEITYDEIENHRTTHKKMISHSRQTEMPDPVKGEEVNNTIYCNEKPPLKDPKSESNAATELDPPYKLSLTVRTIVSDHRKPWKKPRDSAKEYYVTKISPKDKPIYVTPKSSDSKVQKCYGKTAQEQYYYAKPIVEKETKEPNVPNESYDDVRNETYMSEHDEDRKEEFHKQFKEEVHITTTGGQEVKVTEYEHTTPQTRKTDSNGKEKRQNHSAFNTSREVDDETGEYNHESANKHISRNCNSSEMNETRKRSNLVEHINVYHGKNHPNEDIQMVNKTITGKVGKSDSTEVFINGRHVEVVSPKKKDVSKEVKYSLVTSKHPQPQYFIKEPQTNYGPRTLVHQEQSLDQQVHGQSKVQQTVECLDKDSPNTNGDPNNRQGISKSNRSDINMTVETYDHSSHELVSTSRKTKQVYGHMKQVEDMDPTYGRTDRSENDNETMLSDIDELIGKSVVDVKSFIPKDHTNNLDDRPSRAISQVSDVNIPMRTNITKDDTNMKHQIRDSRNAGISNYEYEETSSLSKKFESTKVKRKLVHVSDHLPSIPDRTEDGTIAKNQNKLHDSLNPNLPVYSDDKRPKVSFQNDNYQNVYKGVEFEETNEEDSTYTSKKMQGKRISLLKRGNSQYQEQEQSHPQLEAPINHNLREIKLEIPEPHYITRVPKQPLVEFEAYPVDPHEPFKIISESQEVSSSVKTHKTFMMFKKINGKAVLNQPSVIEPIQIKPNRTEQYGNKGQLASIEQIRSDVCSQGELPLSRSRTVPILSVKPPNQHLKSGEIEVERNGFSLNKKLPQSVILKNTNDPALPRDLERRLYTEYEYSETSLLSQQKIIRKQKRYMYNVEQPPLFEEPNPSNFHNERQAISNNISVKNNNKKAGISPLQLEELPTEVADDESVVDNRITHYNLPRKNSSHIDHEYSNTQYPHHVLPYTSKDSKVVQDTLSHNRSIESDNTFQNTGQYIDQEYYEHSTNKKKTHISSKKQFESNQRGYIDPSQYSQPGPSRIMQIQPQEHKHEQDSSYHHRNATNDNAFNPVIDQHRYSKSSNDHNRFNSNIQSTGNNRMGTDIDSKKPPKSFQELTNAPRGEIVAQHDPSQNRHLRKGNAYSYADVYVDQEYYESSKSKNKSYKSRKFISDQRSELDPQMSQPGPSMPLQSPSQNSQNFFRDEPTRDTTGSGLQATATRVEESPASDHKPQTHHSHDTQPRGQSFQGNKSNPASAKSLGTTVPSSKTDGDIVIYIRQPRARKEQVVPKITVDVTDTQRTTPSQMNQQTVNIQELKPKATKTGGRRISPRISKSSKTYRISNSSASGLLLINNIQELKPKATKTGGRTISPRISKSSKTYRISNSSASSSDGDIDTSLLTESNEEQVLDTTHYNLTLKSQTKVDISKSEKANVKSKAQVRITPLSSRPRIEVDGSCSDIKMAEETETTSYETSSAEAGACDARQVYQSPIKIDSVATVMREYPRLRFHNHWNASGKALLENNGKTLRASLPDFKDEDLPWLEGGPLVGRYKFYELHFHWGRKDCCGAEHVIDGERHSLEAHFLYIKSEYASLETGMQYADGLATIGVKFDILKMSITSIASEKRQVCNSILPIKN